MNNIFIIQRQINNTGNVKDKKMPSQCHSVALLTICGLTCKTQNSFSATCGHTSGISECQTWKKQIIYSNLLNSKDQYLVPKKERWLVWDYHFNMPVPWSLDSRSCLLGPFPGYHMTGKFLIVSHSFLIPFVILMTKIINAHCRNSPDISPPTIEMSMCFWCPVVIQNEIRPHIILCTVFFLNVWWTWFPGIEHYSLELF